MEKFFKLEVLFAFFAMILGLLLIFFTPPLMSADEPAHLARAYSITEGKILLEKHKNEAGTQLPRAIKDFEYHFGDLFHNTNVRTNLLQIKSSQNIKLDKNDRIFIDCAGQAMFSPAAYLPQCLGIFAAKLFTDSVFWTLIVSKIFLLLFYVGAGYFAIRDLPVLKLSAFLVLLMPMSLSLGSSVSADGVLIALSVLYFSQILRFIYSKDGCIDKKQTVFLSVVALLLALTKQSFLICLFALFIPKEKFGDKYLQKISLILLPALIAGCAWGAVNYEIFTSKNGAVPQLQTAFILSHPFLYLYSLLKTFQVYFFVILYTLVGILGWLDVFLFPFVYWLYLIVIVMSSVFEQKQCENICKNSLWNICFLLFVLAGVIFISTVIYISWVPPYTTGAFSGLVGRYYIPLLLPVLFLCFCVSKSIKIFEVKNFPSRAGKITVSCITGIVFVLTWANVFFALYIRYYSVI